MRRRWGTGRKANSSLFLPQVFYNSRFEFEEGRNFSEIIYDWIFKLLK